MNDGYNSYELYNDNALEDNGNKDLQLEIKSKIYERNKSFENYENEVGTIITVENEKSPNFSVLHFRLKSTLSTPSIGTMVAIKSMAANGNQCMILARVVNAWENNPHQDAMSATLRDVLPLRTDYADEGESTVIYRIVETEPLEEAEVDSNGQIMEIHEVKTLPRAGSSVYMSSDELIVESLGLEKSKEDGLYIGKVKGEDTPIVLSKNILQRHIFIGGGIGSGKSYTRGVLAEELYAWGVPQVNIDVNGEMVEATEELGGKNVTPGDGFTLPLNALTAEDIINAAPSLGGNMIDLVKHAHEELLKESYNTGKHFLLKDLVAKIAEVGPHLEMKSQTIKPAIGRVESLKRIKYLGEPFNWEEELKPGTIININCKGFLVSDLRIITAAVARDIQRLARLNKLPFVILSIDEFHLVAPNHDETVALQVLREIARIGRHFKIGLILTTQSPQDVDRSILKRLLTRFLHAIEPDQLDSLRGVFSDASDDLIRHLPKLPQGTCIITGAYETIKHATVVKIRKRYTTHGGKTPDVWSELKAQGWENKKDLISKGSDGIAES